MPLSQNWKTFSEIFMALLQSTQNFVHFEKKDQLHSVNILEIIDSEKYGYLNARTFPFWNTHHESTCSWVLNIA